MRKLREQVEVVETIIIYTNNQIIRVILLKDAKKNEIIRDNRHFICKKIVYLQLKMQKTVIMIGQLKKIIISICMLATTISTNAQGSGWNVNPYDYPYDMTVYGQLVIDDITVVDYSNRRISSS